MATSREEMIELLEAKYPNMFIKTTEEFDGSQGGIWSSGEDGLCAKDGHQLFHYYSQDMSQKRYIGGVHKEIYNFLNKYGWYGQWNDPGTIMFWEV